MEEWEVLLREKLEGEIPEGIYSITIEGKKYLTGRGGVIDDLVDKERVLRESQKK
jgi:hypothetical protein